MLLNFRIDQRIDQRETPNYLQISERTYIFSTLEKTLKKTMSWNSNMESTVPRSKKTHRHLPTESSPLGLIGDLLVYLSRSHRNGPPGDEAGVPELLAAESRESRALEDDGL